MASKTEDVPSSFSDVAFQTSAQPTNKVSAASNVGGGIAGAIAGIMAAYGGPAIIERLGEWGVNNPDTSNLIVMLITGGAAIVGVKYGGQAAAYNILDKPNVAMIPAPAAEETKK